MVHWMESQKEKFKGRWEGWKNEGGRISAYWMRNRKEKNQGDKGGL